MINIKKIINKHTTDHIKSNLHQSKIVNLPINKIPILKYDENLIILKKSIQTNILTQSNISTNVSDNSNVIYSTDITNVTYQNNNNQFAYPVPKTVTVNSNDIISPTEFINLGNKRQIQITPPNTKSEKN